MDEKIPIYLTYNSELDEVILNDRIRMDAAFFRSMLINGIDTDSFICAYFNPEDERFEAYQASPSTKLHYIKVMLGLKSMLLEWQHADDRDRIVELRKEIDLLLKYHSKITEMLVDAETKGIEG